MKAMKAMKSSPPPSPARVMKSALKQEQDKTIRTARKFARNALAMKLKEEAKSSAASPKVCHNLIFRYLKSRMHLDLKKAMKVMKAMKTAKGPNKQQALMSLADKFSTFTGNSDDESDDSVETVQSSQPVMRRPAAALKRPGACHHKVDESAHSDRLKKAAWKRAEARGEIPPESLEAHQRANRAQKRSIINNAIVRLPNGGYELCLGNSAVLSQVRHAS